NRPQPSVLLARTKFPCADAFASALHPTILPFLARQASTKGAGDPVLFIRLVRLTA
ncbi:MAG: hypothetical protein ACI8TQ_002741, partial [Planctomycetota bacterium]